MGCSRGQRACQHLSRASAAGTTRPASLQLVTDPDTAWPCSPAAEEASWTKPLQLGKALSSLPDPRVGKARLGQRESSLDGIYGLNLETL